MIGFFPSPLPNELWYSVCARYAKILGVSSEGFSLKLFDNRNTKISVDLPSLLQRVVSKLPQGHLLTSDRIINDHTLLPFYAPFMQPITVSKIKGLMTNKNGRTIHTIAGISVSPIPLPKFLRFCPNCIQDNNLNYGTNYWNRLHQIPGVLVCPEHKVFLEDSIISPYNQINKISLYSADQNVKQKIPKELDLENKTHKSLLYIAEDAKWLLELGLFQSKVSHIKTVYSYLLNRKELLKDKRGIDVQKLSEYVEEHFSMDLLKNLHSNWDSETGKSWLYKVYNCFDKFQRIPPLRHLILIHALGERADSFFSNRIFKAITVNKVCLVKEFVDGPYPCLNPVCKYFRVLRINKFEISSDLNSKENFIIVSCECGFKYRRRGKDQSFEDIFRKTWVISYGSLWEDNLVKLWNESNLSLQKISKILGVKANTIKWLAVTKGLRFPRSFKGKIVVNITPNIQNRLTKLTTEEKIKKNKFIEIRDEKQKEWIKVINLHPDAGITELKTKITPALTQWLYKFDRDWFKKHPPKNKKNSHQINWKNRDKISINIIKKAVINILTENKIPIRVSKERIARFFEKPNWIVQKRFLNRLPLSKKLLEDVTESRLEFNLRKIKWAVGEIIKEKGSSQLYLIAEKAKIHYNFRHKAEIKKALENGQHQIELARLC